MGLRDIPFGLLAVVAKSAPISLRGELVSSLARPDRPPDLSVYPDMGARCIQRISPVTFHTGIGMDEAVITDQPGSPRRFPLY